MDTFQKVLLILYPSRVRGQGLFHGEKIGIIDPQILSYSTIVKGKIAFGNKPWA
jgi:hypothetical protein